MTCSILNKRSLSTISNNLGWMSFVLFLRVALPQMQDFGLSTIKGTPDAMDGLFGSLDYIAPEALTRKAHCEATDMWAVGVILYILLSG